MPKEAKKKKLIKLVLSRNLSLERETVLLGWQELGSTGSA